jgi:hypothetical protein
MSDEQKRENWYSGVSDVKPIPLVNSSPKSENGSDAMFTDLEEENERRQRAVKTREWMQMNHALIEEERKASENDRIRREESRRSQETQAKLERMERMILETQDQNQQLREGSLNEGNNGGYDNKRWFCATKRVCHTREA